MDITLDALWLVLVPAAALLLLQILLLVRTSGGRRLQETLDALAAGTARLQQALAEEHRAGRRELQDSIAQLQDRIDRRLAGAASLQAQRMDAFSRSLEGFGQGLHEAQRQLARALGEDARSGRGELAQALGRASEQQREVLARLTAESERRLGELRTTVERQLAVLQQDNAARLEQMRATVDEKLQGTLEARLGQSFRLVSERLEAVQRGLGEMQSLASGVGDLRRVLANVKTRGMLGEVQLGALLAEVLAPGQYVQDVATVPGSSERVEFAICLPGQGDGDAPVHLPVDAKFPLEDYQRLLDAEDAGDAAAAAAAGRALEARVRDEARRISDRYLAVPHTTAFAVLFLPTEGLYAEVIRRPGLFERLQREQHVIVAGPTTLAALLNSLQMGFRTLAIARRSHEVWRILGAVKTEFGKFGEVLDRVKKKLDEAGRQIDQTGVRTRAIERQLREVEELPDTAAAAADGGNRAGSPLQAD